RALIGSDVLVGDGQRLGEYGPGLRGASGAEPARHLAKSVYARHLRRRLVLAYDDRHTSRVTEGARQIAHGETDGQILEDAGPRFVTGDPRQQRFGSPRTYLGPGCGNGDD